jgi:hypothetical protein
MSRHHGGASERGKMKNRNILHPLHVNDVVDVPVLVDDILPHRQFVGEDPAVELVAHGPDRAFSKS